MDDKIDSFSPEQMRQLAASPSAQALMAMLQINHSQAMASAAAEAQKGNLDAARQALSAFMADPRAQALIKKIQEETNG